MIRRVTALSDWIVSAGTLVLASAAIVSARYAAVTLKASNDVLEAATKQAAATEKLPDATHAMFLASSLPLLADVPQHRTGDGNTDHVTELVAQIHQAKNGGVSISVPTRNVGTGPAIVKSVAFSDIDGTGNGIRGSTSNKVVPSGETTLMLTNDEGESDSGSPRLAELTTRQFRAIVDYSDYSGQQNRRTVIYIIPNGGHLFLRGVDVHECDAEWNIVGSPVITNRN